jgi:hypothetical protein
MNEQKAHLSERRTEEAVLDLLKIKDWATSRPPKGRLVRQNEYKSLSHLGTIFKGKSKSGKGSVPSMSTFCLSVFMALQAKLSRHAGNLPRPARPVYRHCRNARQPLPRLVAGIQPRRGKTAGCSECAP